MVELTGFVTVEKATFSVVVAMVGRLMDVNRGFVVVVDDKVLKVVFTDGLIVVEGGGLFEGIMGFFVVAVGLLVLLLVTGFLVLVVGFLVVA